MNNFSIEFLTGNSIINRPSEIIPESRIRCTSNTKEMNNSLNSSSSSSSSSSPHSSPTPGHHQWRSSVRLTDYNLAATGWKTPTEFKTCKGIDNESSAETSASSSTASSPVADVAESSETGGLPTSSSTRNKPAYSYIALISMAILNSKEKKVQLGDIYYYIMDRFPYYNNKTKAWRNSIRHNLSLNECFIKNGKSENGKGYFWSIHPACVDDFLKGDFRRRQARRRARKNEMIKLGVNGISPTYQYDMRYVPMTSSILPESLFLAPSMMYPSPPTTFSAVPMMPGCLYPSITGMSTTSVNQVNSHYHSYQNILSLRHVQPY